MAFTLQIIGFLLINITVVSGLVVLYGYCNQISLAQGAFFGVGAYSMAIATTRFHVSAWAGLLIAIFISAVFGKIISLPALKLKGHYLAMGTLAFAELMLWVFTEATPVTGGIDGIGSIGSFGGRSVTFAVCVLVTLLVLLFTRNIIKGIPGECMKAIASSEHGARACGIAVEEIKANAYIFASVTAGIGGALYASLVGFISPTLFAASASIMFLAMVVIGGRKSLIGPILSVVALTFIQYSVVILPIPNGAVRTFLSSAQVDFYALLIIALMLIQARRERTCR
ncbi:MAG: branched-chain amino acid ABC transporter permease [Coriobacteriia bacterium]|nr:branched-chain amino acid ABC transporter permease [Coriobacteriia bacterium]